MTELFIPLVYNIIDLSIITNEAAAIEVAERFLLDRNTTDEIEASKQYLAEHGFDQITQVVDPRVEPLKVFEVREVPCGWVCEWETARWIESWKKGRDGGNTLLGVIGANPLMVNRWTGEVKALPIPGIHEPNYDVIVRDYINGLPPEQREACKQRKHLELNEPVQFHPPVLRFSNIRTLRDLPETVFELVYDVNFLGEIGVAFPPVLKPNIPTIGSIELQHDAELGGILRRARYLIVFDPEQIVIWFGVLGNVIHITEPGGTEGNSKLYGYWLSVDGTVEDLLRRWEEQMGFH